VPLITRLPNTPELADILPVDDVIFPPEVLILPVAVIVSVLSPVKDGFRSGALSAKVDASDVPLSVIAGVDILPVKVGLARGA
jgi:hypothetical protein